MTLGPALAELAAARDELLRSTVRSARLVFKAYAASVFVFDPEHDELSLEATSEEDADKLLNIRIKADSGIAGWAFQTGESSIVSDPGSTAQFNYDVADATGYIPATIVAVPVENAGRILGVLEILDPAPFEDGERVMLTLAEELGRQCGAALITLELHDPVSTAASVEQVMDRIVASVRRLGHSPRSSDVEVLAAVDLLLQAQIRP